MGGIRLERLKDLKKIKDKKKRREELENAKQKNQQVLDYLEWIYAQGEILVMHPEGTRNYGKMGGLKMSLINFTKQIQEKYSVEIPVVPIGIEYTGKSLRSKVYLRAGNPLNLNSNNIEEIIYNEIKTLSNIE